MDGDKDSLPYTPADNENGFLEIDVSGEIGSIWAKVRAEFISLLGKIGDFNINPNRQTSVRDEMREYSAVALSAGKEMLRRPGVKNAEIEADVIKKLSETEKLRAETRKMNAEAAAIEAKNEHEAFLMVMQRLVVLMDVGLAIVQTSPKAEDDEFVAFLKSVGPNLRMLSGGNDRKE